MVQGPWRHDCLKGDKVSPPVSSFFHLSLLYSNTLYLLMNAGLAWLTTLLLMKVTILKPCILLPAFLSSPSGCPTIPRPNISPECCLFLPGQDQDSHWELTFRLMFLSLEMLSNFHLFIYFSFRIDTNVTSLEIRLLYYIFLGSIKLYFLISVPISVGNGTFFFFLREQWLTYVLVLCCRCPVGGPVAQSSGHLSWIL